MRRIAIAVSLAVAMVSGFAGLSTAAEGRNGPHPRPDYFTVNNGVNYFRFKVPTTEPLIPTGTASQTVNPNHSISLNIDGATNYADDGFYVVLGRLGDVNSIVVTAAHSDPGPFSLNLWFDSNHDGDFFVWVGPVSHQELFNLSGDQYGFGPKESGTLTVNDSTSFYMQGIPNSGQTYTLAQLKSGDATGIDGNTLVAAWIGICCGGSPGNPVSQSATIQSMRVR